MYFRGPTSNRRKREETARKRRGKQQRKREGKSKRMGERKEGKEDEPLIVIAGYATGYSSVLSYGTSRFL